jgi:hypothetical protein
VQALLRWKGLCALVTIGGVLAAGAAGAGSAAPAANHQTFTDAVGDNSGGGPDIGTVDVSNDDAGTIVFRVAIPNRTELLEEDSIGVYMDVDEDTKTGCIEGLGADYQLAIVGHGAGQAPGSFLGACLREHFNPLIPQDTFSGSFDSNAHEVVLSVNRREIANPVRLRFVVAAAQGENAFDSAGAGLLPWLYEVLAPPPPPDRTKPHVKAIRSSGARGGTVQLRYTVSDDSGRTREEVTVLKGKTTVYRHGTKLQPSDPHVGYAVSWRAPRKVFGKLRFCVRAWDPSGNRAGPSCAPVTIR